MSIDRAARGALEVGAAQRPHIPSLTGLRFFLALHVVIHHAWSYTQNAAFWHSLPAPLFGVVQDGYLAPGAFYTLSGFILTLVYFPHPHRSKVALRSFWMTRFARIYPVYLLALLLTAPWFFRNAAPWPAMQGLILVPTMLQAWIPQAALLWNGPAWSVSTGAFFYLMFPFITPLILRQSSRRLALLGIGGCLLAAALPYVMPYLLRPITQQGLLTIPAFRLPEFLVGIVIAEVFGRAGALRRQAERYPRALAAVTWTIGVLTLAAYAIWGSVWGLSYLGTLGVGLFVPLHALLIFALALGGGGLAGLLSRPAIVLLGEASYALYLIHGVVWQIVGYILLKTGLADQVGQSTWYLVGLIVLTVPVSIATFYFIEQPARRWLRPRRRVTPAAPEPPIARQSHPVARSETMNAMVDRPAVN